MDAPPIQYARTTDGISIAYSTVGEGKAVVDMPGVPFRHMSLLWTLSAEQRRTAQLASSLGRRWVMFDPRGMGSSAPVHTFSLDGFVVDLEAVADKLGLDEFDVVATTYSNPIAIEYAVRHPKRVSHLVLVDPFLRGKDALNTPVMAAIRALRGQDWTVYTDAAMHILFGDTNAENSRLMTQILRAATAPERAREVLELVDQFDITPRASCVKVPTLVVSDPNGFIAADHGRAVAATIPSAQFILAETREQVILAIGRFLGVLPADASVLPSGGDEPRVRTTRTVLFTDIVGHTEMMQRLGDANGRDVLREHERITRETLKKHGGAEVKTMGDGFMASFGSVTSAMECAIALQRAFAQHTESMPEPLHVRVGLNAGEPIEEDGDLFGATVILASRIAAKAGAGEILVPDTVRGLLSGKGFMFSDRGEFVPKGFDEGVRLWDVRWQE
jgi:class 3 adenylate cyclase